MLATVDWTSSLDSIEDGLSAEPGGTSGPSLNVQLG